MKTLMRVSWSENNRYGTFSLTHSNHLAYCKRQNYTYMAVNEQYSAFTDLNHIKHLLNDYDIVFTCDSDIVFTDINKPIVDFAQSYLNASVEDWCPIQYSLFNGGFLIFYKKDNGFFTWLDKLIEFQEQCKAIPKNIQKIYAFQFGPNNTQYYVPMHAEYGTQSVLNLSYLTNQQLSSRITPLQAGTLQSYLPQYLHYGFSKMHAAALWNPSKFCIHLIGLRRNDPKFKSKVDVIADFFTTYPEYCAV